MPAVVLAVAAGAPPAADGSPGTGDQLYRISYDGSIVEERKFVVMGGVNEPVITALNASFRAGWDLPTALRAAVTALGSTGENAPSHRVFVGRAEIGAAWSKRSNEGRDYLGLKLDDPSFNAPIYANLFDDEDGEAFSLIWSRPNTRRGD